MNIQTMRKLTEALSRFAADHEYTVTNAMSNAGADLKRAADELQQTYDRAQTDTAYAAELDRTLTPTAGLPTLIGSLREGAARYDAAGLAWDDMMAILDAAMDEES